MRNQELVRAVPDSQTDAELLDAIKSQVVRGLARLAETDSANPRTLELLQRALHHRDWVALKKRELDLRRQRLDLEEEFLTRTSIRPRRRIISVEIQSPAPTETAEARPTQSDTRFHANPR